MPAGDRRTSRRRWLARVTILVLVAAALMTLPRGPVPPAFAQTLSASPFVGAPTGARVVISGSGWSPGREVGIWFDDRRGTGEPHWRTTASGSGTINRAVRLPARAEGTAFFFACRVTTTGCDRPAAIGPFGGSVGLAWAQVEQSAEVDFNHQGPARLSTDLFGASPGMTVAATGDPWANPSPCGDVALSIDGLGGILRRVTPTAQTFQGIPVRYRFSTTFTMPDRPPGSHTLRGRQDGDICQLVATRPIHVVTVTATPSSAQPGDNVSIGGLGWPGLFCSSSVAIYVDNLNVGTVSRSGGQLSGSVNVPSLPQGTYTLEAVGTCLAGQVIAQSTITVLPIDDPVVSISPPQGPTGTPVEVRGIGYEDGAPVDVTISGRHLGTVPGGSVNGGAWTFTGSIPSDLAVQAHPVEAAQQSSTGPRAASTTFTVTEEAVTNPRLSIAPSSGPAGTPTVVEGSGYLPGEPVTLTIDGDTWGAEVPGAAVQGGSFTGQRAIPQDAAAGLVLVVGCQRCGTDDEVRAITRFAVTSTGGGGGPGPQISVDPVEGVIGTPVTVTGDGFTNGVDVTLTIGGVALALVPGHEVVANAFTFDGEIPPRVVGGPQEVVACQRCGEASQVQADTTFTVLPRLELQPAVSAPGRVVRAMGDGFPVRPVTLSWSRGIGAVRLTPRDDGTLVVQLIVFHRDLLGRRELIATSDPPLLAPGGLDELRIPFVVTPGTVQPGFTIRR